jgi:hypothetical protein
MTARTGLLERDSQNVRVEMGQAAQDRLNRTGQAERGMQNESARKGQAERTVLRMSIRD